MISKILREARSPMFCGIKHKFATQHYVPTANAQKLLCDLEKPIKRTKMINTIGPKTETCENAGKLIDQGMNVARLNFSHGDHAEHLNQANAVRDALKIRPNYHASILLDTKGPQIRTGNNQEGKQVVLKKGQLLQLTTDYGHLGNDKRIACSYADLANSTEVGKKILFADGGVSSVVKKIENGIVTVEILNDGKLGSKKNMCLPGAVITLPTITDYDRHDIIQFGVKHKVDFIAVSFARYKRDLDNLRKMLIEQDPEHGANIQIVSKIENHEAVHNIDEIIDGSDGIMVARGDLGMQVPIQKVVLLQKFILDRTLKKGKYCVTATQMLESMETKPRPTRAQVSDITNACFDLSDAVMTSGETTNGQFPFQCAKIMSQITKQSEAVIDYKTIFDYRKRFVDDKQALGIVSMSFELGCDLIMLQTDNFRLINRISSLRPKAYICVFSDDPRMKNGTALNFGVYCFPKKFQSKLGSFLQDHGSKFGLTKATALHISTNLNGHITRLFYDIASP